MARAANPSIKDRRFAQRAATRRKAVVICANPATPLFTGTAVDISREGMGIRASTPLPSGTAVDLEVEPREESETVSLIRVSGFVARCDPAGSHEFVLGVQLHVPAPLRAPSGIGPVRRRGVVRPVPSADPLGPKRTIRLSPWLAVLTAILLFLLWWPFDDSDAATDHRGGTKRARMLADFDRTRPQASEEVEPREYARRFDDEVTRPGDPYEGYAGAGEGPSGESLDLSYGMGGPGEFVSFVDEPEGGEPGPAEDRERTYQETSARTVEPDTHAPPSAVQFPPPQILDAEGARPHYSGSGRAGGEDAVPTRSRVHIDVNRDTYEMTVFVDSEPAWRFPVGLGRKGSTPSGDFTIHNKIARPNWYHRGESVPYGDARNPLGESWMGLASDGTPLSYGIHPTNEPDSIGDAKGAGCIRMRPEDAEKLFRLCPVGATVHIRDAS